MKLSGTLMKTIIVVLLLAIIGASAAFFFIWRELAAVNAQLRPGLVPVNIRIIADDGIYDAYEAWAQIVRHGRLINSSFFQPYTISATTGGELFEDQDVLREHVLEFKEAALSDMIAFGYRHVQIQQIYMMDFNEDFTISSAAAVLFVTDSEGRRMFIPYARMGNYAVTHTYGMGRTTVSEVIDGFAYIFDDSPAGVADSVISLLSYDIGFGRVRPSYPTAAFEDIIPVNRSVIKGDFLAPNTFTNNSNINITARFYGLVPFNTPGQHVINISLENEQGDVRIIEVILTVYDGVRHIVQEACRNGEEIKSSRFFSEASDLSGVYFNIDETNFSPLAAGFYYAAVKMEGMLSFLTISVVDTTPPAADANTVLTIIGQPVYPEDFVINVFDYSYVEIRFLHGEPNVYVAGEFEIPILLTDAFGNAATVISTLMVLEQDFLPPEFEYIPNRFFQIGEPVNFLDQVRLSDGSDPQSVISYNISLVNKNEAGRYRVYYTAVDRKGSETSVFAYIVMTDAPLERVMSYADRILASILRDDMTQREEARAIYDWVRRNIMYSDSRERGDPVAGALAAFTRARGDCFIFYAVSEILLTRAGIKNIQVTRIPGTRAAHYWHFVNVSDGWYHFDTTPQWTPINGFMFTDAEAERNTAILGRYYYVYDRSLFTHLNIR